MTNHQHVPTAWILVPVISGADSGDPYVQEKEIDGLGSLCGNNSHSILRILRIEGYHMRGIVRPTKGLCVQTVIEYIKSEHRHEQTAFARQASTVVQ